MDFAALMNKELSKTKKPSDTTNKYLKRSEIEDERKAKYLAEQKALEEERQAKEATKRKREDEIAAENKVREDKRRKLAEESRKRREEEEEEQERARRKHLGLPELIKSKDNGEQGDATAEDDLPEELLRERLRELGEPVMLFGESDAARRRRYKKLSVVMTDGPIPTTLQLVDEKDMKVDGIMPKDAEGKRYLFRQLASYFTMVLSEYEKTMEQEKNETTSSQVAYSTMVQARESMVPLFRKFENDDVEDSVILSILRLVNAMQERRYVDANNIYLRLSIGRAAWPIGVTMVGIHERSAHKKLHDAKKGQVMADEVTRKILQSIKRCLTFAQVRWPPHDLIQLMG